MSPKLLNGPSITAFDDTREEAAREIQVALDLALASAREAGVNRPRPHWRMFSVIWACFTLDAICSS